MSKFGNYVMYNIKDQPVGYNTMVVQSTKNNWKMEISRARVGRFSPNEQRAFFLKGKDSLGIVTMNNDSVNYINNVKSYKSPGSGSGKLIAYQLDDSNKILVVHNLLSNEQTIYQSVKDYVFSEDGNVLLLLIQSRVDNVESLIWINLLNGEMNYIWKGKQSSNYIFNTENSQLAFIGESVANGTKVKSLWYYKQGMLQAKMIINERIENLWPTFEIDNIQAFTDDGARIFIQIKEREILRSKSAKINLDVWSYFDRTLQSEQLARLDPNNAANIIRGYLPRYKGIVNVSNGKVIKLEQEGDNLELSSKRNGKRNGDVGIIINQRGLELEKNWNSASGLSYYLISLTTGMRKQILQRYAGDDLYAINLSPDGKYILYYNAKRKNYFTYTISTGKTCNITVNVSTFWTAEGIQNERSISPIGIAGWFNNDEAIIIYDQFDIWKVDPTGEKPPLNLTNGYGLKHNIVFRLALDYSYKSLTNDDKVIIKAFNQTNKNSGFYQMQLNTKTDPKFLSMGPYVYYVLGCYNYESYILMRQSATASPNYFYSTDLKNFKSLSNIYPESMRNWITSQLITWKTLDGYKTQGVLYKPQNFDSTKKYPLIFCYYEKKSNDLHLYQQPENIYSEINIPWFVSNGYLVFTPDIYYKIGQIGKSALSSIVAAAKMLSKKPWVNEKRMGIQGHSFGGLETNYLVTHSNLFAAAVSGAGISNCISDYGSITCSDGVSRQYGYELGHEAMRATLWERPEIYINNSPIFMVHKVTTPILLMNNKADGSIPFAQGVEFFTALRRLGKKAWMLQYDGEDHFLNDNKVTKDYTIRMTQFFDHYLIGKPAPKWMTRGIPASLKGIDDGLEFDSMITTPSDCLLNAKERKKLEVMQKRSPITITLE